MADEEMEEAMAAVADAKIKLGLLNVRYADRLKSILEAPVEELTKLLAETDQLEEYRPPIINQVVNIVNQMRNCAMMANSVSSPPTLQP